MTLKLNSKIFLLSAIVYFTSTVACNNSDNNTNIASSVSGTISYKGNYSGTNTIIYIRAYKDNERAVGEPDFYTSIDGAGSYKLDLGNYKGTLYLSAFMDVDKSGNTNGPSASDVLNNGVYSDPLGCYGDYAFENTGPLKITVEGQVENINFELSDSGVLKTALNNTGHCIVGVIKTTLLSDDFLHHTHADVLNTGDIFFIAVPSGQWYCKNKFDVLAAQLYPKQINISANKITAIDF